MGTIDDIYSEMNNEKKLGHYSLKRVSDGAGDSGLMSTLLWVENDELKTEENGKPRVGVAIRVGTPFARTYSAQDWWMTTICLEILEEFEHYVKFKTKNSVYIWKEF